jgi:shikimate dehydrogenase
MKQTRMLVGLIGANILRSLSPALHEDAFAAVGMRGHYHLMDLDVLPGRTLPDLLQAAKTAGFGGLNITYPCKEAVIPLLDEVSAEARQIGAVNTVTFDVAGRAAGYNTDRVGFRRSFEEGLGRAAAEGKTAVMVGAGGAGRAVAFALLDLGVSQLLIHDTGAGRAAGLVADLVRHVDPQRCRVIDDLSSLPAADGVVNATPLGMLGHPGNPIPDALLRPHHWVADVIYTPLETELIRLARSKGARTLTGGGMCVHQAAEAFRLFTGLTPDLPRMHQTFAQALAARDAALAAAS